MVKWFLASMILNFAWIASASGQVPGKEWTLVSSDDEVKVWHHSSNSDVTGTFQVQERRKAIDWSKTRKDDFFESFESKKTQMLSLIGIRAWKAQRYEWKTKAEKARLSVVGTYENVSGEVIRFHEVHFFEKLKTTQILYTRPLKAKLVSDPEKSFIEGLSKGMDMP